MPLQAFLLPTPLTPNLSRPSIHQTCTHAPKFSKPTTRACATLPAETQALLEKQQENPLFDVKKPPSPLSETLSQLELSKSYISLSDHPTPTTTSAKAAEAIRIHAPMAIDAARAQILERFPGITAPGGALYPEMRAKACWRDLSEFCRVVGYGVACGGEVFSESGVECMKEVYKVLKVPIEPLIAGVAVVGLEIAQRVEGEDGWSVGQVKKELAEGFGGLLKVLEKF